MPGPFVPVFDQVGVILKKQSRVEQQSTLVIDEPAYPEQLLEIGKTTLQNEHLVVGIGGAVLQHSCLGVYLVKKPQRGGMFRCRMMLTRAAFGPLTGRVSLWVESRPNGPTFVETKRNGI